MSTPIQLRGTRRERLYGAFVLVILALACVAWWIGLPMATLWALSKATDDGATHFVAGLIGVPLMLALCSPILFWLNGLYLRVTGVLARLEAEQEESGWHRTVRGPLEPMMLFTFLVSIIALSIWFFVFAKNPPQGIL